MTPERWQEIKRLLDESVEIAADQRTAWLEQACGGDPALREEVESYLAFEDELHQLSISTAAEPGLTSASGADSEEEGRLIGPYRIDDLIGRGGMGAVFRAHRETEFEQWVALKLVRRGLETPAVVQRFHTERQILARLVHPNIARLLDGGTSDQGRPYFVMELIEGAPIDRDCDQRRLNIRARLQLVLQVCGALQYAHGNLVVHRDLKPSNILVTEEGVPKLLDFGIGKLLGQEVEPERTDAELGSRPLTLSYASPEQLLDRPITTASDIYSLGVVLYELLTGRLPYDLDAVNPVELGEAIMPTAPPAPSAVVLRTEAVGRGSRRELLTAEAVAETRERSPSALHRRLRGDLDAIVLKALHKDPAMRYGSAEQLAADLRRHLEDLPVEARPGNLAYRAGKLARRYRWGLSAAAIILVTILAFTAALSSQLQRTERQRQRSDRLSMFMVDLFRAAEPDRAGEEPSVRELIDIGRQRLETDLQDEPEARAELLGTLGQVYYRLGHFDAAKEATETAIAGLRQQVDRDHRRIPEFLNDLSVVAIEQGDSPRAEEYLRQSIAIRQRLGAEADLTKPRNNLAAILMQRGELEEAEAIYRQSLSRRRATLGPRHPNVAISLRSLAMVLYLRGEFAAAEPLLRESLDIRLEVFGSDTPSVATVLASLGRLAHARGDLDSAEPLYLEALEIRRQRLGPDHLSVAILQADLAKLLLELGEIATASVVLGQAFGPIYLHKPEGDWLRADLESAYGALLAARGRLAEAEVCLSEGYRTLQQERGPEVLPTRDARRRLAEFRATVVEGGLRSE